MNQIIKFFVFIGIFLIPFNSWKGLDFLGEFSTESSAIFLLLAFILFFVNILLTKKINIPLKNPIFILLIIVHLWFLCSFIFNFGNILNYEFKGISGINRFIRQFGALIFSSFFFTLTYYYIFEKFSVWKIFIIIRKIFFLSFSIVTIYAFLEIGFVKFNLVFLENAINLFDYFPFVNVYLDTHNSRISSITFEPPALSSYLLTISAWMFSYILTSKSYLKYIPAFLVVIFAYFSDSRSAILIISIQFLVFLYFLAVSKKYKINFVKIFSILILGIVIVSSFKGKVLAEYLYEKVTSLTIDSDNTHNISNRSRLGIQYTLGLVFLENPISGVGLGQQAYESIHLYPSWATKNNYEFELKYLNEDVDDFPPGYNLYMRLLAETGIIGFVLFTSLLLFIFLVSLSIIKNDSSLHRIVAVVIFISMIGFVINWVQIDTFRVFGFWIVLSLLLCVTKNKKFIFSEKILNH